MEEEGLLCTTPEIRELAETTTHSLLPDYQKRRTKNNSRNLKIGVKKIIYRLSHYLCQIGK
jgi:hypothetical protein